MSTPFITQQNIGTPLGRFWFLSGMLSNLINSMKVGIHTDPELVFKTFEESGPEKQNSYLDKVSFYVGLIESAIEEGIALLDDKTLTLYALEKLELTAPPELFDHIKDGDYIELYDPTGVQLFANLEFCAQISYSIEETFMFDFEELYTRDAKYKEPLLAAFQEGFTTAKGPFSPNVESHYVEETFSPEKKSATVKPKFFCPIRGKSEQVEILLCCLSIQVLK